MFKRQVDLLDGDCVDLMSFIDAIGISVAEFDVRRLRITFVEDDSHCWYEHEKPTLSLLLEYEGGV